MVGSVLNHYRITKALGSGRMGEVYLAEDTRLERPVAIKILPASLAAQPDRRERFEREAQAVAGSITRTSSPHIPSSTLERRTPDDGVRRRPNPRGGDAEKRSAAEASAGHRATDRRRRPAA